MKPKPGAAGQPQSNPDLILPVGTQVVTSVAVRCPEGDRDLPIGAVGVIVRAPTDATHAYRVRMPNGHETSLKRRQFEVRKLHRNVSRGAVAEIDERRLYDHIIYRCIVGSRAYGLEEAGSDTDRRGIFLPPADLHWSLTGVPEQLENHETQECYWEIQKFITLALKANPNILECLYTPLVEHAGPIAEELRDMRSAFLSRLVYQTYNGYVISQFKKLERHVRERGSVKWKHAMHLIRLLLSGVTVLREGHVPVRVEAHRDRLMAIRNGEVPWEEVDAWRLSLHADFDAAFSRTRLPERPDYERVNGLLVRARMSMVT